MIKRNNQNHQFGTINKKLDSMKNPTNKDRESVDSKFKYFLDYNQKENINNLTDFNQILKDNGMNKKRIIDFMNICLEYFNRFKCLEDFELEQFKKREKNKSNRSDRNLVFNCLSNKDPVKMTKLFYEELSIYVKGTSKMEKMMKSVQQGIEDVLQQSQNIDIFYSSEYHFENQEDDCSEYQDDYCYSYY